MCWSERISLATKKKSYLLQSGSLGHKQLRIRLILSFISGYKIMDRTTAKV